MPAIETIAVLGAGHGGCAALADLTARGYRVRLHARREATLAPLREAGGITARGVQNGTFQAEIMTTNVAEAIAGADLIMLVVPSHAHESYAKILAGLIDGSVPILLNPGHTGGALNFLRALREAGFESDVKLAETVSLTYITRMEGPAEVGIYSYTKRQRLAALPATHNDEMFDLVHPIYPETIRASNVLETGIANLNAVFHPPGMIMNAGWIERTDGGFMFYKDGITDSVGRATKVIDDERIAVATALDVPWISFLDSFLRAGLTTEEAHATGSIARACEASEPNKTLKSPPTLDHRYIHEDVGYGLVPFTGFGDLAGVKMPTTRATIELTSAATGIDYFTEGLTLAKMGIDGMSIDALRRYVETGAR